MHVFLGLVFVGLCAAYLVRTAGRARTALRGQAGPARPRHRLPGGALRGKGPSSRLRTPDAAPRPRGPGLISGFFGHRRTLALEKLKHRHTLIRDEARHRAGLVREWAKHQIRMNERQAEWDRMQPVTDAKPAPDPASPPDPASSPDPPSAPAPATVPGSVVQPGDPEPQQPPAPQEPQSQPGGTPVSTGTSGAVEQVIDGLNAIHAAALAGNIHAKRAAVQTLAEAEKRIAAMCEMLAREMAEPGSNYGPEITEPIAAAGTHAQASAMVLGDADTAVVTLINMQVGELADSPRQAPDKTELTETGAR